jgi:hypothetical protein
MKSLFRRLAMTNSSSQISNNTHIPIPTLIWVGVEDKDGTECESWGVEDGFCCVGLELASRVVELEISDNKVDNFSNESRVLFRTTALGAKGNAITDKTDRRIIELNYITY